MILLISFFYVGMYWFLLVRIGTIFFLSSYLCFSICYFLCTRTCVCTFHVLYSFHKLIEWCNFFYSLPTVFSSVQIALLNNIGYVLIPVGLLNWSSFFWGNLSRWWSRKVNFLWTCSQLLVTNCWSFILLLNQL